MATAPFEDIGMNFLGPSTCLQGAAVKRTFR